MTESSTAPTVPAGPSLAPVEFSFRGKVLTKEQVAGIYLGFCAALLALGVGLNYLLTGGHWIVGEPSFEGTDPQYLQNKPYDIFSGSVLVVSLLLLGVGFFWRHRDGHIFRAAGFSSFGFYWGTQAMRLYVAEGGDFVNAIFAGFGVFFFNYFAYHEIVSYRRDEDPRALQWLSGTAFITTGVYFVTHKLEWVANWLILRVAEQTNWLLNAFGQPTARCGGVPDGSMIYYPSTPGDPCFAGGHFPIQIILACTAIQSIMIFVGGITALKPPREGDGVSGRASRFARLAPTYNQRRLWALLLTVPLIWVLNLFRNVIIIWMSGQENPVLFSSNDAAFWFSHNVIGKGGSLVALVIIAFIVFQILPELYDSIIGLLDLKQRRGPLETWLGEKLGRRGRRGPRQDAYPAAPGSAPSTPAPPTPAPVPDRLE